MTGAEQRAARERVRALSSRRLRETIRRGMRLARVDSGRDLAALAGVSEASVSCLLSGSRRVPAAVRILAALGLLDELGVGEWSEDDYGGVGGP